LDNFEHLLEAGPLLAETSPPPTSRHAGYQPRERRLRVSDGSSLTHWRHPLQTRINLLRRSPHQRRPFVERARAVSPTFALTVDNASAVAEICRRLDGLPLCIELAAGRAVLLSPQEILRRLDHRLSVLTNGPLDVPTRQQTLRHTLEWSYELLMEDEQRLLDLARSSPAAPWRQRR
jgi:predicted ATPase